MPRKKQGSAKTKPMKVQIGNHNFVFGKGLSAMPDYTQLYKEGKFEELRYILETEGYLYIRNVIPKDIAMKARDMMLKQAMKDGSVINNDDIPYTQARIVKQDNNKYFSEGYCVDGITGTETNERNSIDCDAWMSIGPSKTMKDVYFGESLKKFWKSLFSENNINPLVKQTFLRLMGDSGTQEHADYYYFKKDTHIFSGNDGRNAINALNNYKTKHKLSLQTLDSNILNNLKTIDSNKSKNQNQNNEENVLFCHICENCYLKDSLDSIRLKRLNKGGFGVSGEWHCPKCMIQSFGIYTTWISLSELSIPKDSILGICPKSHLLKEWDIPKPKDRQLCNDFNWRMKWVIPKQCNIGDIIIFNIKTIHASSFNASNPKIYRVSCDTRILLTNENNDNNDNDNNNNYDVQTPMVKNKKRNVFNNNNNKLHNPSPHPSLKSKEREFKYDENEDSTDDSADGNNNDNNENKDFLNNLQNNKAPMMTRARAKKLMNNKAKNAKQNELKRISKSNDVSTDQLTRSMSDLKINQ